MSDWTDFGLRHRSQQASARRRPETVPGFFQPLVDRAAGAVAEPLRGVTTDGEVIGGLFADQPPTDTAPVIDAALAFLAALIPGQAQEATMAVEADERRLWLNVAPNLLRHGVMLEDLTPDGRQAALGLVRTSLSARGYDLVRDIMRINGLLVDITGQPDNYGEWPYFFTVFGTPSASEPWGWQMDGHHVNLNCTIVGDRLAFTPSFLGSEPCTVATGPLAGTEVFGLEHRAGIDLMRALDQDQRDRAILSHSMDVTADHPADGRMRFGAFRDNVVEPYVGLRADGLTDAQRRLLVTLVGTYVGWGADGPAGARMDLVARHLDETWFSWIGTTADDGPFYYRVHGPVALVEFDHQPGVVFDNDQPTRHHVHTVLRTPNGGDYGADLLAQHHERFDHSNGHHH